MIWDKNKLSLLPIDTQKELLKWGKLFRPASKDTVFFAEHLLGVKLHEGQKSYLRETNPYTHPMRKKNILQPSNRWGKTVILAVKHLWFCFFKIGFDVDDPELAYKQRYATLDLSPHSNQVEMCYNYMTDILKSRFLTLDELGNKVVNKCRIASFLVGENMSKHRLQFSNNTMFFGQSTGEDAAAAIQGFPFGYISYDECVQSHHLEDELPARIFSRTIDYNAPVDLTATPDSEAKSQQYYYHLVKLAAKKKEGWDHVHIGKLDDNTFLSLENREAKKKELFNSDPEKYLQVVEGKFVSAGKRVFPLSAVEEIWDAEAKMWETPETKDQQFLISGDWGGSDTGDPTVIFVIRYFPDEVPLGKKRYQLVHHEKIQGGSPTYQLAVVRQMQETWNNAEYIGDSAALGGVWIKKMLNERGMRNMHDFTGRGGDKGDAVLVTKDVIIRRDFISYYISELEEQLGSYEIEDAKITQDFVVALYQALWWLERKVRKNRRDTKQPFTISHGRRIMQVK